MTTFTLVHVLLSLVGIGSGVVVLFGLIAANRRDRWTALFLATTAATSLTGFLFPFHKLLPSHVIGIVSLVALAIAIVARYSRHLRGAWRAAYTVSAIVGLYLNVLVLIAQAFQKIPALHALAPTQSEAPFAIAQLVILAVFIATGILAVERFNRAPLRSAEAFG